MFSHLKSLLGFETGEPERNREDQRSYDGNPVFVARDLPEDPKDLRHVIDEMEHETDYKREQLSKLAMENNNEGLKRKLVDTMYQHQLQDKDKDGMKESSARKKGTTRPLNKQIIRRVGPADELSKFDNAQKVIKLNTAVVLKKIQNQNTPASSDIHKLQKMNVTLANSHYKNEDDNKMDDFKEDLQNQKVSISSSMLEDSQKQMDCFGTGTDQFRKSQDNHGKKQISLVGTETDIFSENSQNQNSCTKNDKDESENHRENSHNNSTCSSTDVFLENNQNQSDCVSGNTDYISSEEIADIEIKTEGFANNSRSRLGSVESLRQVFEKKHESAETKGVSQTDQTLQLATDFKEKLKMF